MQLKDLQAYEILEKRPIKDLIYELADASYICCLRSFCSLCHFKFNFFTVF